MATYDIVQQTYNVGTETTPIWRPWYAVTLADAVKMGADSEQTIVQYISQRFSDLMGEGVPETFDTIKEIYDYIKEHKEVATALNTAIANKVDKVEGKGLSTNDLTNELLTKLETAYGSAVYTNATPTPVKHGGIAAGTTFENASINSIIENILYGYVRPNATITLSATADNDVATDLSNGLGSLYYNGETGEETYGTSPFTVAYVDDAPVTYTIKAIVNITNKGSDYTPTIAFKADRGQTITTTVNEDGSVSGVITPTAPATISITITDPVSEEENAPAPITTTFKVIQLNNIPLLCTLTSAGFMSVMANNAITETDIETVILKKTYNTEEPYRLNIVNYDNRPLCFLKQGSFSKILDKNGLDITNLFSAARSVSLKNITNLPDLTDCKLYYADIITVDNFYIEIYN